MSIPVEWAAEVCAEADLVLAQDRQRIQDGAIDGQPWAAHCYSLALERVRRRRGRT